MRHSTARARQGASEQVDKAQQNRDGLSDVVHHAGPPGRVVARRRLGARKRLLMILRRRARRKKARTISHILVDLAGSGEAGAAEYISCDEIMKLLHERGFGLVLLMFALPNLVPIPIPLASLLTGPFILLFAVQIVVGHRYPKLPRFASRWRIRHEALASIIERALPYIHRLERFLKPRILDLHNEFFHRFAGVAMIPLAVFIAMPLPLTNWLPAFSVALYAIALLQRDGLLVIIAAIIGASAMVFIPIYISGLAKGLVLLFDEALSSFF